MSRDDIAEFIEAMQSAGILLAAGERITPDGKLHRARAADDKPGALSCWYNFHPDAPASGVAGNWRTGARLTWCGKRRSALSHAELDTLRERMAEDKARAEAETKRRQEEAAQRAAWVWTHAQPASPTHPYLARKHLQPGIARQRGDALILPVYGFDGALHGVQYIRPDGVKRFIAGMAKKAHFTPAEQLPDGSRPLWICEGWATSRALQAARPNVCLVAGLDAGNLQSVALEARRRWPRLQIVVCPDFDAVGQAKGKAAAIAARAHILPPPDVIPGGVSDWLDLANYRRGVAHA